MCIGFQAIFSLKPAKDKVLVETSTRMLNRAIISMIVLLLAQLGSICQARAQNSLGATSSGVSGRWKIEWPRPDGTTLTFVVELWTEGEELCGAYVSAGGTLGATTLPRSASQARLTGVIGNNCPRPGSGTPFLWGLRRSDPQLLVWSTSERTPTASDSDRSKGRILNPLAPDDPFGDECQWSVSVVKRHGIHNVSIDLSGPYPSAPRWFCSGLAAFSARLLRQLPVYMTPDEPP